MRAGSSVFVLTLGAGLVTAVATPFASSWLSPVAAAVAPAAPTTPTPRPVLVPASADIPPARPDGELMRRSDARTGRLLFEASTPGRYVPAPLIGTDVTIDVSGPIARTTLVQSFTNGSDAWVEGVYVFPLPDTAAVDGLKVVVGDRMIEGTIKPREEAKVIYETAKAQGYTAALTEQERPNLFTNSVANIGPGETVTIRLTYQETVEMEEDRFSLRFPMVVGPRYHPPASSVRAASFSEGGGFATEVTDVARTTTQLVAPGRGPIHPVRLRVNLDAGFPVADVTSGSHALDMEGGRIAPTGDVFADRDFTLEWTPESGTTPSAGLFSESVGGSDYHLLMVTPPSDAPVLDLPRDVTFILDVSGSMAGESLRQAKAGLLAGLETLGPGDRFNIVAFDNETYPLWTSLRDGTEANLDAARRWLGGMTGGGGTEMLPALRTALGQQREDPARLSQILFLTDGAIDNEDQLFATIERGRGAARVFTIGMGSAPNTHFMRRASELGQGSFTHIGDVSEAAVKMDELTARISRPVMTDIRVQWPEDAEIVTYPDPIPDLFAGEALTIAARLPGGASGNLRVTGLRGGEAWEASLPLASPGEGASREGVSKLWAREAIATLELDILRDHTRREPLERELERVAMEHSLVSRLTSLVAVDVTPRRVDGQPLHSVKVATNLPKGWEFAALFADAPRAVMSEADRERLRERPRLEGGAPMPELEPVNIPRGSTPSLLASLAGLLMLFIAWCARRRERHAA